MFQFLVVIVVSLLRFAFACGSFFFPAFGRLCTSMNFAGINSFQLKELATV